MRVSPSLAGGIAMFMAFLIGIPRSAEADLMVVTSRSEFEAFGHFITADWGVFGPAGTLISYLCPCIANSWPDRAQESPQFQMAPKVSANAGTSASRAANRSIRGSRRISGMFG